MRYRRSFSDMRKRIPSRNHRSGKLIFLMLLMVAGIIICFADQTFAQIREEVEKELDRTDRVIERAKEAAAESRNPKAENLLKLAMNLQGTAKEAFEGERFWLAAKLTLRAREKAFEAIGVTRRSEENENLVLKAIERTDQIIAKAKGKAFLADNQRAFSLLEIAIRNQQKAKEFYHEHKLKVALKLTLKARESAQKSIDLAEQKNKLERFAKKELEKTDKLIDKASPIVKENGNVRAQDLFDKGADRQEMAKDLFGQKRFNVAIKNTQKARDFILKALKTVEENPTPRMVEKAIERNDDLINKLGPQIKVSGNQEAIDPFENGLSHQEKAKLYLAEGKLKAALAQAKVARRLITKAFDMIDKESL